MLKNRYFLIFILLLPILIAAGYLAREAVISSLYFESKEDMIIPEKSCEINEKDTNDEDNCVSRDTTKAKEILLELKSKTGLDFSYPTYTCVMLREYSNEKFYLDGLSTIIIANEDYIEERKKITNYFTSEGYEYDVKYGATGPTGESLGYRKNNNVCIIEQIMKHPNLDDWSPTYKGIQKRQTTVSCTLYED
jgi:hypothetical protein